MEKLKILYASLIAGVFLLSLAASSIAESSNYDSINIEQNNYGINPEGNSNYKSLASSFKLFKASATIKGSNEIPKVKTGALGAGEFLIDTKSNRILFNIVYYGLEGNETAAHIHGMASRNMNAPVLFTLPITQGYKTGVWNYPENIELDIIRGKIYVNIHSTKFPNGEIRGQIIKKSVFTFKEIL